MPREQMPTTTHPDSGDISAYGVVVSEAFFWVEDGIYVIQSSEFDLIGEGDTLEDAVTMFAKNLTGLHNYLADLVSAGDATQDESRIFAMLSKRHLEICKARDREIERTSRLSLFVHGVPPHDLGTFQPSTPKHSEHLLPA